MEVLSDGEGDTSVAKDVFFGDEMRRPGCFLKWAPLPLGWLRVSTARISSLAVQELKSRETNRIAR